MSIEYEDLTMQYGCLGCKHEWYDYSHATIQSSHIECPECSSTAVWEDSEAKESNRLLYDDLDFIRK